MLGPHTYLSVYLSTHLIYLIYQAEHSRATLTLTVTLTLALTLALTLTLTRCTDATAINFDSIATVLEGCVATYPVTHF